jgi:large subunit ribosomal protein L5
MATTKSNSQIKEKYSTEVVPALQKAFNYKSSCRCPVWKKIAINRGVNGAVNDKKLVDIALEELSTISGQKAVPTMSKKDISNFKLRKNMPIGAKVTLRGEKMYEFLTA